MAAVRTAVFYSGSLLNVPLWQLTPVHAQQAFDQLARRCAVAPACARFYHPAADLATVARRLRAHPARATIWGPNGQPQPVTISLTGFLNAIIDEYLSSPDTAVLLPQDLHAFAHGQWATVINKRGFASALSSAPTQLQKITLRCSDAWAAMNPAAIAPQARPSVFTPALAAGRVARQGTRSGRMTRGCPGSCAATSQSCSSTAPPTQPTRQPTPRPHRPPCPTPCWSRSGGSHEVAATGCITALSTAFILAGKPANRARWAACARTMGHYYPAFPAAP